MRTASRRGLGQPKFAVKRTGSVNVGHADSDRRQSMQSHFVLLRHRSFNIRSNMNSRSVTVNPGATGHYQAW